MADIQNFALRAHCVHGIPKATNHIPYWIGTEKNDGSKKGPKVQKHVVGCLDEPMFGQGVGGGGSLRVAVGATIATVSHRMHDGMVKDQGPLGGNLTVCWAAEMEGSQVASLNLGWQRRWTPSCIADSPLSTHLGSIPSGGVRL